MVRDIVINVYADFITHLITTVTKLGKKRLRVGQFYFIVTSLSVILLLL